MRVAIATLGCKVNHYDSAALETRLRERGCALVPFAAGADVYVVNTCSVTDRADAESRQLARRAKRLNAAARVELHGSRALTNCELSVEVLRLDEGRLRGREVTAV